MNKQTFLHKILSIFGLVKPSKFRLKKAFTLAETIIALVIIGILAIETIPPLLISIDKIRFRTAAKKFYAEFYQAHSMLVQNPIVVDDGSYTTPDRYQHDEGENYFIDLSQYLKFQTICQAGLSNSEVETEKCWPRRSFKKFNGDVYIYDAFWTDNDFASAVSATGVSMIFQYEYLYFDVNGKAPPNRFGYDIYVLDNIYFDENRSLVWPDPPATNDCTSSALGWDCLEYVLKNEDY